MKKIKNVNSISNSTITTIVFSLVAMAMLSIMLMTSVSFASELGDEFGGPGIGMKDTSWDGSRINKIYSYGDLNGIVGNEIVEHKASSTNGPTAVDSMINPSNFIKLLTMKPGDFTFLGGSKDDKLVK